MDITKRKEVKTDKPRGSKNRNMMGESDVAQIKGRLTTLEVKFDERWNAHDTRANERNADVLDQIHSLGKKFDGRPCADHVKTMLEIHGRVKNVESWIDKAGWAIGVIYAAVAGAVVTIVIRHFSI